MKNILFIILFCFSSFLIFAEQIDATNKGIANASPGDYVIRENGDKIILNQADIDYAKNQLGLNTTPVPVKQYTTRTPNENYSGSGDFFLILFIIGISIGIFVLFKNLFKVNNYNNNQGITYIDENGYRRFTDSNKLVHRWVIEKKIGRKLRQGEIVHHINRNKLDNSPENLEVFANQDEHQKHHDETDWLFKLNRRMERRIFRSFFRF